MYKCKDNVIITIGRTFGSGAREIGKKVAGELGIPFYDKELLEIAAKESGGTFVGLSDFDEKRAGGFLTAVAFDAQTGSGIPVDKVVRDIQVKTIKTIADQGSCVIVGRRADKILREEYDTLNVFISAPIEKRISRVSKRDGLSEKDSRKKVLRADKTRQSYYNAYGEGNWGEASNYNLCIDSSDLGTDNSAAMILQYLKLKGKIE